MPRTFTAQKAGLTRAVRSADAAKVRAELIRTRDEWDAAGPWPDDWHRWNIAARDWFGTELDDLGA